MNMSTLLTRIKRKLGLMAVATPFEDINEAIMDIIYDTTLPVFSKYEPVRKEIQVDLNCLKENRQTGEFTEYLLPDYGSRILFVEEVRPDITRCSGYGYYAVGYPSIDMSAMQSLMISNASAQLMSATIPAITFEFEDPNLLRIYNCYISTGVILRIAFQHDNTLSSIPLSQEESFFKLALLDVKDGLYPTMKYYNDLQTAHGNISLKIDDWQNAESERNDLIERWEDTYHLDGKTIYYG